MFSAPHGDRSARLSGELFAVIERQAWDRLLEISAPDVAVEVHAHPTVLSSRNEHIWRSRSLRGREEVRAYLGELHHAVPALALQPRGKAWREGHEVVRVDCAGVDGAGSPFDAVTDFAIWEADGMVVRVEAEIGDLAIGTDVIRRTDGDPRRYFESFLGRPEGRLPG
ncbi:MAG: nuclear transport factor 2 family protein [Candidatus Dormibacteria bacterium]